MAQQDYTAPEQPIRISQKEWFREVLELVEWDEQTPDLSMKDGTFAAKLLNSFGARVAGPPGGSVTCTRLATYALLVEVSSDQWQALQTGRYRLEVYHLSQTNEREDIVCFLITLV